MLLNDGDPETWPDAILHLDFDLPNMQRATALDMAIEIVSQLSLRWSTGFQHTELTALVRALGLSDGSTRNRPQSVDQRDYRKRASPSEILQKALYFFGRSRGRQPRLILFADSYERAELLDEVAAKNVSRIVDALRAAGVDLMVIYAARSFLLPERLTDSDRATHLSVKRFAQGEAVDYLVGKARQRGIRLSRKEAARANRIIRGWPLALRLAVSMLGTSPETFEAADWLALIETDGRSAQATLYERLLDRIEDDNLRRLAKPGLLARRITVEVIRRVLAEPCGLPPDVDAVALMVTAEYEGQLFWRDSADPGALWHRQDLREIMLPLLRMDVPGPVAKAIHDNAVDYYSGEPGDIARGEELYHRLCRGDPQEVVEERWRASAGQRLVG